MSRVKRLLLTSRTFFVTVNLRKNLTKFTEKEFSLLLEAMEESRRKLSFSLYGYVLMPDHWHASLRGAIDQAPTDIAMVFMNNLAYMAGRDAIWQYGYYVGTFGEYDMDAVRDDAAAASATK